MNIKILDVQYSRNGVIGEGYFILQIAVRQGRAFVPLSAIYFMRHNDNGPIPGGPMAVFEPSRQTRGSRRRHYSADTWAAEIHEACNAWSADYRAHTPDGAPIPQQVAS